jgi:hypothetical protein
VRITVLVIIFLLLMPILSAASDPGPANQVVRGVPSGPLAAAAASFPRLVNASRGGPPSDEVNPNEYITQEPAPMGIADYGVGPSGPYEYATNSSLGTAEIASLSTVNATGDPGMTIQLNVNLQFSVNDRLYVYWIQDVASIETNSDLIQLVDNVWNFSSPLRSVMSASAVSGDGVVASDGNSSLYYDIPGDLPGNNVSLSLPATVQLEVDSRIDSSGQPAVDFSFNDGPGWQRYDTVTFLTTGKLTLPGFVVDGFKYNPLGIFYDSELILGGPGDGLQTTDVSSDVRLQLYYSNGDNFEMVSNAYNFGSDTAEGMNNTLSQWDHYPGSGQNFAEVQSGAGTLGRLYDSSQIGTINVRSAIASGTLYIVNATDPSAPPGEYPFVNGNVTVTLFPGEYTLQLYQGGVISDQTNVSIGAGQYLSFKTPFGGASLTLSYSVAGGGSGHYSPPVLTYVSDGVQHSTVLTTTPTTYLTDSGTSWSVTPTLSGSSGTQRWQTDQQTNGTLSSFETIRYVYFNQFLVSVSYALTGGGTVAAPHLNYTGFGEAVSLPLTEDPQLVWIDSGSQYSVPQILAASSSSTERWYDGHAIQGTIQTSSTLSFSYYHQFLLVIINAGISSQWYNSSSTVQFSVPGVSGRAAGYGQRITSYSIDDGSPTIVQPTTGAISISIQMDSSHQVSIASVEQYQVSLDASAAAALSSITPPTISGDTYWYDLGTQVSLVFNGVWDRSADTGQRLVSYSVNGNSSSVSTTGSVDVSIGPLSSPENVSGDVTTQYHLTTQSGSVASVTAPTIGGDGGWYDGGTQITVTYYYSWNNASGQSRDNALSYSAGDGTTTTTLERSGTGTFPVRLTISSPENITIYPTAQYSLDISGGHDVSVSIASPTGDAFYDAGSTLTATTELTWGLVDNNDIRQELVSYTFDSVTTSVTNGSSGEFTTPGLTIDGPTSLVFNAATQDLVVLQFRDSTGTGTIAPSSVQIEPEGSAVVVTVPSTGAWLDNGTRFQIYGVEWESADVKPAGQTIYTVNGPLNQTVLDRVYSGTIVVKDYLGLPISGARVSVILANGTTIASTTGSNGSVALHEIPVGTYTATIAYLGTTTSIDGNAAQNATAQARLLASYPVIGIAVALLAVVVAASLVLTRRRHQAPPQSSNS